MSTILWCLLMLFADLQERINTRLFVHFIVEGDLYKTLLRISVCKSCGVAAPFLYTKIVSAQGLSLPQTNSFVKHLKQNVLISVFGCSHAWQGGKKLAFIASPQLRPNVSPVTAVFLSSEYHKWGQRCTRSDSLSLKACMVLRSSTLPPFSLSHRWVITVNL